MKIFDWILCPLFLMGWIVGFVSRYFLTGWYNGISYLELREQHRREQIARLAHEHLESKQRAGQQILEQLLAQHTPTDNSQENPVDNSEK